MEAFKSNELLAISQVLVKVALEEGRIQYNEVSKQLATSYNVNISPDELEYPFAAIDEQAYELGLPIISSVVIGKETNRPGVGYFRFIERIKNNNGYRDKEGIWIKELQEVFKCRDWTPLLECYKNSKQTEEKPLDKIRDTNNREDKVEKVHSNPSNLTNEEELLEIMEDQIEVGPKEDSNEENNNEQYDEGSTKLVLTNQLKRNPMAPKIVKDKFKKEHEGKLFCEICGFDFAEFYGAIGEGYIEAHHIKYLSVTGPTKTSLEDLALLCANCHRVLHKSKASIEEMRNIISNKNKKLEQGRR